MAKTFTQVQAYMHDAINQGHKRHLAYMRRVRNRVQQLLIAQLGEALPQKMLAAAQQFLLRYAEEDDCYKTFSGSALTPQLAEADQKRDNLLTGIRTLCEAQLRLGNDDLKAAAQKILDRYRLYQLSPDLKYEDEGIQVEQFCQDLDGSAQLRKALQALGLTDHATALKEANELAMNLIEQRNQERGASDSLALKKARRETDDAYRLLTTYVNAYAITDAADDGSSPYDTFINTVNADIDYHRQWVVSHPNSDDAPDEEPEKENENNNNENEEKNENNEN